MSTHIETHAEVTANLDILIANLADMGAALAADRQAKAEQEKAERYAKDRAELAEKWRPILERIRAALPDWMHPFVMQPGKEPEVYNNRYECFVQTPVSLQLPDVAPIYIYHDTGDRKLRYTVPGVQVALNPDGDAGEKWYVYWHSETVLSRWDTNGMLDDIAIAVYQAQRAQEKWLVCQADNEVRNSAPTLPAPPSAPRPSAVSADALTRIAEVMETLLESGALERIAGVLEGWRIQLVENPEAITPRAARGIQIGG